MLQLARWDAVAPAMGKRTAHHQMHMARRRWAAVQMVTVAMDIAAQLITMGWVTVVLMWRTLMMALDPRRRRPVHLALVLPLPLTLPLRMTPLFLSGRVAVLGLVLVVMLIIALLMRLARRIWAGCGVSRAGK